MGSVSLISIEGDVSIINICIISDSDSQVKSFYETLRDEMATHSSILAWKIPRTGEPGGLQSMGSQREMRGFTPNLLLSRNRTGMP